MIRRVALAAAWFCLGVPGAASAQELTADRVLLLWNSENAESAAVRDAYVAARPGVLEFDFDSTRVSPGAVNRAAYNTEIRNPVRSYLSGTVGGAPLSERVIAIATTRGLPARVDGPGEFTFGSERASLESELALVFQDLDDAGGSVLPVQRSGIVDNPYHRSETPIAAFDRSGIMTALPFDEVVVSAGQAVWRVPGLTAGGVYLVTRLDAGAGAADGSTTALEETIALIERSADPSAMTFDPQCVRALFDEYPASVGQLDDDGISGIFPNDQDFENAAATLRGLGIDTTHDETVDFVTGGEFAALGDEPLLVYGTYGENHDVGGAGENPPGTGQYLQVFDPHPAGVMVAYESFGGQCLVNGGIRQGQACAGDWIARGGSFVFPTVSEPFTFSVADLETFTLNFYVRGMTFAEAAYASTPGLSWANTPVGDPLARVTMGPSGSPADFNGDGEIGGPDLGVLLAAWGSPGADLDGDGTTGSPDLGILLAAWGPAPACP